MTGRMNDRTFTTQNSGGIWRVRGKIEGAERKTEQNSKTARQRDLGGRYDSFSH